ncbi:hypothetical protein [Streptomyces shenzhenensis]|uniref:hypothetical protein n=1 Tax=Streptomyces shenzhenensis TaxID=943815 RepID=UPI001F1CF9A0|nr:hypothetical protein [Streptomyces shenzhenensis]
MGGNDADREKFIQLGCGLEDADILVRAGIDPDIVGIRARDAVGFASAAVHHGLADPNGWLEAAGGDPDEAWKAWATDSVEGPVGEGDDEGDADGYDEGDGGCRVYGWVSAYIGSVGPGEYTIELYDDLGLPGNATYVDTLTFSLPVTAVAGSPGDRDACVIKAATEELAAYGCTPGSDFLGRDGSFSVQVQGNDRALEWLEDQRSVAEKLELLLAGLHGLLDDPAAVRTGRDRPAVDVIAESRSSGPVPEDARTSIVDWDDRESFFQEVAAQLPDQVVIERYHGGWARRLDGARDLKHPGLRGLKGARAEAARHDDELSGFTAAFRSGDKVHRYRVQADWAEELDRWLKGWEQSIRAVREEQSSFPHLKRWGKELREALLNDEQYLAGQTPSAQDRRGAEVARSMFGSDCPVQSLYIRRALTKARAGRTELLLERQREQWKAAVPAWAAGLADSADFQQGTTAERAMLASNLLYAHDPAADTPELVRLLRTAAAALLPSDDQSAADRAAAAGHQPG